jgi:hypothetical protein
MASSSGFVGDPSPYGSAASANQARRGRTYQERFQGRALADHLRYRSVEQWSLRQVVEQGQLAFECNNCWRLAAVDTLEMVERFGADATVGQVRPKAVCRVCHARGA